MVTVHLAGKDYQVDETSDVPLMQQLKEQGAEIVAACNGAGICQTCAVTTDDASALSPMNDTEELMSLPEGQRLSCQCNATKDCSLDLVY